MSASTKSGWFTATLLQSLTQVTQTGSPTSINLTSDTALYIVLSGSGTTDYTVPVAYNSATPTWTAVQEVTSTTNWPTGGIALSRPIRALMWLPPLSKVAHRVPIR